MTIEFTPQQGMNIGRFNNYSVNVNTVYSGTLEMKEDGYYDWYPILLFNGYVPSWVLRSIADKIDELNKDWDEQVKFDVG